MNIIFLLLCITLQAPGRTAPNLSTGLLGSWIGTLEYRDYSDNSRVKLATLLRIYPDKNGRGLIMRYVYDDGPAKVVQDEDLIEVEEEKAIYSVCSPDEKSRTDYAATGLKDLHPDGTGTLILMGKGTENNAAVDIRETLEIKRDHFSILRESRLPGQSYLFRHRYDFTRVSRPKS